ncbi:MAG: M48 family metalloprotease [Armatimonadota bacterium]
MCLAIILRSFRKRIQIRALVVLIAIFFTPGANISALARGVDADREKESMGRRLAAQVEKSVKLVSGPLADRVRRIGNSLAVIANGHQVPGVFGSYEVREFSYKFKVIDSADVNAFSLPGGYVYVNSGLVNMAESDDELAGVLAHEIAHVAHHHAITLMRSQRNLDKYLALATFAGILGNARGSDLQNLLLGVQTLRLGKLNQYTMIAEEDADRTAVEYMLLAGYSPQGFIDFLHKLDKKRVENPGLPLGIFQTHPAPHRRIASIAQVLESRGVQVCTYSSSEPVRAYTRLVDSRAELFQVVVLDRVVVTPAPSKSGTTSRERAEEISLRINQVLESGVSCFDVDLDRDTFSVVIRGNKLFTIEPEDARPPATRDIILEQARDALVYAIWASWVWKNNKLWQVCLDVR